MTGRRQPARPAHQRISAERQGGWMRQLRLTPLPPNAFVAAKVIASMVTTVPAIVLVLILGRFYGGIHLARWRWPAIGGVIWLGTLAFAALAVALGYRLTPDRVQPVAMFAYLVMSLLGGLWFALGGWMQKIGQALPTYQITRVLAAALARSGVPYLLLWSGGAAAAYVSGPLLLLFVAGAGIALGRPPGHAALSPAGDRAPAGHRAAR